MTAKEAFEIVQFAQKIGPTSFLLANIRKALDVLVGTTSETYSRMSAVYSTTRGSMPDKWDETFNQLMLNEVRRRVEAGKIKATNGKWKLLDVGAGHGRDLIFFVSQPDILPLGIEISKEFLSILESLEKNGDLPPGSYRELDMRRLVGIGNRSFACVRNHATLHHLPILWEGVGADEAVAESYRVLQPGGIFHVLVKKGNKLKFIDTHEKLGPRLFQLFTTKNLETILERNKLKVIHIEESTEERAGLKIEWVFALAERAS